MQYHLYLWLYSYYTFGVRWFDIINFHFCRSILGALSISLCFHRPLAFIRLKTGDTNLIIIKLMLHWYFDELWQRNRQFGTMERKLLYAFRGWIAFVAFMDLGTAFRSYIEKRSFLGDPSDSQYIAGKYSKKNICFKR